MKPVEEEKMADQPDKPVQKVSSLSSRPQKKNRCFYCNKKIGILGFACKCEYVFCSSHRHEDDHECTFSHEERIKDKLTEQNQKVEASKMESF